jgi:hypothetical protein
MIDISVNMPRADIEYLVKRMEEFGTLLGKTTKDAVHFASWNVCRTLGASTKVAPKLRPIVKNPMQRLVYDKRYSTKHSNAFKLVDESLHDTRRGRYGVMRYKPDGTQKFDPIFKGGEFGARIKYISPRKTLMKVGGDWVEYKPGTDEASGATVPGMKNHPKRIISRSGMAKQSFARLAILSKSRTGGSVNKFFNVRGSLLTSIVKGKGADTSITMTNGLRYITSALQGGPKDVHTAIRRAGDALGHYIAKTLMARAGVKAKLGISK